MYADAGVPGLRLVCALVSALVTALLVSGAFDHLASRAIRLSCILSRLNVYSMHDCAISLLPTWIEFAVSRKNPPGLDLEDTIRLVLATAAKKEVSANVRFDLEEPYSIGILAF